MRAVGLNTILGDAKPAPAGVARPADDAAPVAEAAAPARWADRVLAAVGRHRAVCLGALLVVFVLGFNGRWRVEPDSALYLSVARNLAEGRGYTYHGHPHALAYPGLPYALATLFRLFGSETLVPANLLMLLCGLATLGLIYRLIRLHTADPATATLVTCGVGMTRTFYRYAFQIMTDMPFLMGVTAFFAGYEALLRRDENGKRLAGPVDWALMLFGLGVAVSMRPTMWAFLPVVAVGLFWSSVKRAVNWRWAAAAVAAAAVVVIVFMRIDPREHAGLNRPDRYEDQFLHVLAHHPGLLTLQISRNARALFGETMAAAMFGMKFGTVVNAALAVVVLVGAFSLFRRRLVWGLWVGSTTAMMIVVLAHDRYCLQILPLLVYGWWLVLRRVNAALPRMWGNLAFAVLLGLGIGANLGQVGDILIEQHRKPFLTHYRGGHYAGTVNLGRMLATYVPPGGVVVGPAKTSRVMTYLSRRLVIESNEMTGAELLETPLFVVVDPADHDYAAWVQEQGIRLDRRLITAPNPAGPPPELWSAHLDVAAWGTRPLRVQDQLVQQ